MSEYVDWPNGHDEPVGLTVLLPGRNYPATMPLLTFAGRAAVQHGWHVRAVSWDAPDLDTEATVEWVGTQLAEAVGDFARVGSWSSGSRWALAGPPMPPRETMRPYGWLPCSICRRWSRRCLTTQTGRCSSAAQTTQHGILTQRAQQGVRSPRSMTPIMECSLTTQCDLRRYMSK